LSNCRWGLVGRSGVAYLIITRAVIVNMPRKKMTPDAKAKAVLSTLAKIALIIIYAFAPNRVFMMFKSLT